MGKQATSVDQTQKNVADLTTSFVDSNGSRDLNADRSNALYGQLTGNGALNPTSAYGKQNNALSDMMGAGNTAESALANYQGNLANAMSMNPTQTYQQFADVNPALMQQAQMATQAAMNPMFNVDAQGNMSGSFADLARQQSEMGRRSMEQRLAQGGMLGTDSGAGRTALMQAIINPYTQMMANVANKQADIFSSIYNPQAQATQQNIYQNPTNLMNAMNSVSGSYGNVANIFGGAASQYGNTGNSLLAALSGQSEQAILAPQLMLTEGGSTSTTPAAATTTTPAATNYTRGGNKNYYDRG